MVEVLVEGPARRPDGWSMGKSAQMKTVVFPGVRDPGDVVRVRVESATSHTLLGVPAQSAGSGDPAERAGAEGSGVPAEPA
jgi:hypothetical protein